ncbi:nucleotide exchange factor GrpE [Candidatus Mycoplasma haematobovis]|uniref:Protein GrpE n=1 Tax=Candidatus Mycoplasma haematobovis TaxID=432608 RepID=A0A1A9QF38_9MOLU|nr:nucleotide exchange factor GrpE [Candidatus Mycoplasma haematobovis]OAL10319.1 nucleotide exchange factor GrpE [Candidatus Mycoplasma haematobovis]
MTEEGKQIEKEERVEEELREQIKELQEQIATLEKESNQKIMDFIDKKSKEAEQIILKKEEELKLKFKRELENAKDYLYERQFSELVGIISNFETAIDMATAPEIAAYLAGFKMFSSQFETLLSDLNISKFSPKKYDEFDSSCMEATMVEKVDSEELENKVLQVFSKGYKLNERVIKLSSVKVGKLD